MNKRSFLRLSLGMIGLAGMGVATSSTASQPWPEKPVTIVTPFSPGVSPDVAARILAEGLSKRWKQPVVVENRPGADTVIGTQAFIDKRDPHSLLFTTHATFTVVPLLYEKVNFTTSDVSPISLAVEDFLGVVAAPQLAVNSLPEFVELARTKPGQFNFFAVPGVPHLAYLAFQKGAGLDTTFVAYTNPGAAVADMIEGRIQIAVLPLAMVLGHVRAGKLKLLAVTNAERAPAAPQAPTVSDAGQPALSFGGLLGLFGARDMPPAQRARIAADVAAVVAEPETRRRLQEVGLIARGTTPDEFAAELVAQGTKWSTVARENKITPQQSR